MEPAAPLAGAAVPVEPVPDSPAPPTFPVGEPPAGRAAGLSDDFEDGVLDGW